MPDFSTIALPALSGLALIAAMCVGTWVVSLAKTNVSIIDSVWAMLIFGAGCVYAWSLPALGPRAEWLLALTALWAVRLAIYVAWRNWGEGEDRRYQAIRARNQPNFEVKSLVYVFLLQAVLAWIVSLPLLAAVASEQPIGWLDAIGVGVFALGVVFETVADLHLALFKSRAENRGRVLDTGLWRYTRHPNYFGEFCVWWGFWLIALAAGGWWTIVSPLLMSVLLLKVSGVTLLEKDIGERRPDYVDYIARTNAFFPGMPRDAAAGAGK